MNCSPEKKLVILIVHIDDIIPTEDYKEESPKIKQFLAKKYEVKDLSPLCYFLDMEVT